MHNKMEHNWAFGIGVIIAIGTAYGLYKLLKIFARKLYGAFQTTPARIFPEEKKRGQRLNLSAGQRQKQKKKKKE